MGKHTPGPWGFHGPSKGHQPQIDDGGYAIFVKTHTDDRLMIAEAFERVSKTGKAPARANAALIAAAPELLEALQKIASYPALSPLPPLQALDDMRQIARAAIAKATEES